MKKDLNYIAAVEKAISEKYGKEATNNFRYRWSPLLEQEYLRQLRDASLKRNNKRPQEVETIDENTIVPKRSSRYKSERSCPVCKTYSFSGRDDLYMNRYECCYRCYVDFVAPDEEKWKQGERPTEDIVSYYIKRRPK